MMLVPRSFGLLDDMFDDPFYTDHESGVMKTDIREKKNKYIIEVDLPGYDKENIKIDVEDGYLTIKAETNIEDEAEDEDDNFVRRERYSGSCSRSFYVGDDVESDDITASFKNGILKLEVPKHDKELDEPKKKYIEIE